SRLALVGCVLALCSASAQAQPMNPQSPANGQRPYYADPGYANDGQPADGYANGDYAGDGYADGQYCDDGGACYGNCISYLFAQRRGLFYGTVEALELRRNNQAVAQNIIFNPIGDPLFNTRSLNFDVMIGQKYTAGYMWDEQTMIEATYFSIDNWSYKGLINPAPGVGFVNIGQPLAASSFDYQNAENMTLNYSARLLNAELNGFCPLAWPDISFMA